MWWLVSPQNPLKPAADMAPFAERLAGAIKLAHGHAGIRVTDIEARLGTRYSVDTLEALVRGYPAARFVWLIGADNLVQLPRWRRWTRIFELVPVAVFDRAPYSFAALAGAAAKRFRRRRMRQRDARRLADSAPPAWVYIRMRLHPASATALRALRRGASKRRR